MFIKVEYIGPSTNIIYAGVHWSKRKRMADEAHLLTKIACKGLRSFIEPVSLIFQPMIRGRAYDTLNYSFTAKMIEDGIVRSGILKDDTKKYVGAVTILPPIKIKKPEQSYMEVELREGKE